MIDDDLPAEVLNQLSEEDRKLLHVDTNESAPAPVQRPMDYIPPVNQAMVGPQSSDVSKMSKLLSLFDDDDTIREAAHKELKGNKPTAILEMSNILSKFRSATDDVVETLVESAKTSRQAQDTLDTARTASGVKYGNRWEIKVRLAESFGKKDKKFYDLAKNDGTVIAKDLMIYEAAYALAKMLNQGIPINDTRFKEVLRLEETFATARNDAAFYKTKYARAMNIGEKNAADVFEARYQKSRQTALETKQKLSVIAKKTTF